MTIYAVVNSLMIDRPGIGQPLWTLITPSAILQGGNPYFVPDFADIFAIRPAIVVRIGKLGKSISQRFAYRYVDGIAPAALMLAPDLLASLREKGYPWTPAISYDRSLAIGRFESGLSLEEIAESEVTMSVQMQRGETLSIPLYKEADSRHSIAEIVESVSRDNALKTGDYILAYIGKEGVVLSPGQQVTLHLDGEQSLKYNIR